MFDTILIFYIAMQLCYSVLLLSNIYFIKIILRSHLFCKNYIPLVTMQITKVINLIIGELRKKHAIEKLLQLINILLSQLLKAILCGSDIECKFYFSFMVSFLWCH